MFSRRAQQRKRWIVDMTTAVLPLGPVTARKLKLQERSRTSPFAFVMFLLVNATLFLRPAELLPAVAGLPIYEVIILSALLSSLPVVQKHFRWKALCWQPITMCVVGMMVAVVSSHLSHLYLYGVRTAAVDFIKILIYFGLLVGVVDTWSRYRCLMKTVAICASIMVALCVIDYVGMVDLKFVQHVADRDGHSLTGSELRVFRMRGTGIFQDPNDLGVLIVITGVLCSYFLFEKGGGALRWLWLAPIGVLGTGLFYTRSRGALLAAMMAGCTMAVAKFGKKAGIVAGIGGLALLTAVAGRQGNIDISSGTGRERVLLWLEGLEALKSKDLIFGIGQGFYTDLAGLVAHNSFVHAYVELGLFGGTLFFGCFFFSLWTLYRLSRQIPQASQLPTASFLPYIAAMLIGWGTGLMSLSRCYVVPTYLVIGSVAAYANLVSRNLRPPRPIVYWDKKHVGVLIAASALFFVCIYLFVKIVAR